MSLNLNQNTSKPKITYPELEPATYPARIVQVIDMGKQYKTNYKNGNQLYRDSDGNETEEDTGNPIVQPKAWITFELPTETIEIEGEDRPRWASKEFVISTHEKSALTKVIKACGNVKALRELLGKPCMISTDMTSGGKSKIKDVTSLMKGLSVPELSKEPVLFDLDNPDVDVFNSLPQFLKTKITESVDFGKSKLKKLLDSGASTKAESKAKRDADSSDNLDGDPAPF